MSKPKQEESKVVEIRRYSNRRFYDTSRSRHVTLEEIRGLVRDGRDVRITDATTGEDITSRTLTQIILDYDDEKISAFPPLMLHRIIRASESMLLEFIGQYVENAARLFQDSRRVAEEQWTRVAEAAPADATPWWPGAWGGAAPPWASFGAGRVPGATAGSAEGMLPQEMGRMVEELRVQLENVQAELKKLRESRTRGTSGPSPAKRKSSGGKK